MRRRVLLVQPSLQPPGGGNGVAPWMLQALVPDHDVTVLSWTPVDVAPINRFFGTSLDQRDFVTRTVPGWWQLLDRLPIPVALLRSSLLMRYARRLVHDFEVVLGVHNEVDYGRRGIQYVHYPAYLRPRPAVDFRAYHRLAPLLNAYYALADRIAGFSAERMKRNLTLANSQWTAGLIERQLGINALTLYPPVADPLPGRPWSERRAAFLAIGRLSPEKEYERIIRIVAEVRRVHPQLTLTIVGTWDRFSQGYYERLRGLSHSIGNSTSWLRIERNLSRAALRELMAGTRYGIHAMREEHFGMAPAEMVRSGMIVWVPNGGGQVEIVGDAPTLRYDDDAQAIQQILTVLGDEGEQSRLREHLAKQGERFGTARFMRELRDVVASFEP